jgi:hypothetical protein
MRRVSGPAENPTAVKERCVSGVLFLTWLNIVLKCIRCHYNSDNNTSLDAFHGSLQKAYCSVFYEFEAMCKASSNETLQRAPFALTL